MIRVRVRRYLWPKCAIHCKGNRTDYRKVMGRVSAKVKAMIRVRVVLR